MEIADWLFEMASMENSETSRPPHQKSWVGRSVCAHTMTKLVKIFGRNFRVPGPRDVSILGFTL